MVIPGVTMRNASENLPFCEGSCLFSVCHVISIAMTTVLPLPVAILNAIRYSGEFPSLLNCSSLFNIYCPPYLPAASAR